LPSEKHQDKRRRHHDAENQQQDFGINGANQVCIQFQLNSVKTEAESQCISALLPVIAELIDKVADQVDAQAPDLPFRDIFAQFRIRALKGVKGNSPIGHTKAKSLITFYCASHFHLSSFSRVGIMDDVRQHFLQDQFDFEHQILGDVQLP